MFFVLSTEPSVFPYSYDNLYMSSVYTCYSSKPSFVWSWTSVQSSAKVTDTDTANQYISYACRTSQISVTFTVKDLVSFVNTHSNLLAKFCFVSVS